MLNTGPVIERLPEIDFIDGKAGKSVAINSERAVNHGGVGAVVDAQMVCTKCAHSCIEFGQNH